MPTARVPSRSLLRCAPSSGARPRSVPASLPQTLAPAALCEVPVLFGEALLAGESQLYLPQEHLRDLREAFAFRDRGEVGESYALAPGFHATLVLSFPRPGEARLEEVVAH